MTSAKAVLKSDDVVPNCDDCQNPPPTISVHTDGRKTGVIDRLKLAGLSNVKVNMECVSAKHCPVCKVKAFKKKYNLLDEMSCVTDVCFDDLIETKSREMIETMEVEKEHVRLEKMKLDEKLEKDALEHKNKLEKTTQKLQSLLKKPNLTL